MQTVLRWIWVALLGVFPMEASAQGLTDAQRARIAEDRGMFLDAASTAIAWFGDARGLNGAAVDDYIAAERAARRADVVALIMAADLSADGAVSAAEVARVVPSMTAHARGKLIARHDMADVDASGVVTAAEVSRFAMGEALRLVPDKRASDLRLLLVFDADDDGWVTFAEVKKGIADISA